MQITETMTRTTTTPAAARAEQNDPFDDPADLMKKTLDGIAAHYEDGTLEYIRDHRPDLHGRLAIAMDRIDETGSAGGIATTAFKNALRTWYNLNLEAIKIFKESKP